MPANYSFLQPMRTLKNRLRKRARTLSQIAAVRQRLTVVNRTDRNRHGMDENQFL